MVYLHIMNIVFGWERCFRGLRNPKKNLLLGFSHDFPFDRKRCTFYNLGFTRCVICSFHSPLRVVLKHSSSSLRFHDEELVCKQQAAIKAALCPNALIVSPACPSTPASFASLVPGCHCHSNGFCIHEHIIICPSSQSVGASSLKSH